MSYPSINRHLEARRISLETASDAELAQAFVAAFREDLPLGMARIDELVEKLDGTHERAMVTLDPNSQEGKQFARLLGPDIPRRVLEGYYGVAFGFYNCCKGVTAHKRDDLKMTLREQIEAQHPSFVDC
jgi:uncharacterized protein with NRDE domain